MTRVSCLGARKNTQTTTATEKRPVDKRIMFKLVLIRENDTRMSFIQNFSRDIDVIKYSENRDFVLVTEQQTALNNSYVKFN